MFTTISQSLAFHQSPEAFISRQVHELAASNPGSLSSTTGGASITRASILNRQVHVISSYQICQDILSLGDVGSLESVRAADSNSTAPEAFSVGPAYRELMSDWFPAPNILLEDSQIHTQHKAAWKRQIDSLPADVEHRLRQIAKDFLRITMMPGSRLDLYETSKTLAWKFLLGAFLGLDRKADEQTYEKVEQKQEAILRGQFSLLPVAVNTPFWQSARSRGLKARKELQQLLLRHILQQEAGTCPLLRKKEVEREDIANHCLLFTSSIANKALASLLTASIMNIFLMSGKQTVASLLRAQTEDGRTKLLRSILLETERLSPPVVGVMRRVEDEVVLTSSAQEGHIVPKGHDVWLYFAGASRDENIFDDAQRFHFDRYMDVATPRGFAFSAGRKTCLGSEVVHTMVSIVVEEMLNADIELLGEPQSKGVQAWLGWETNEDVASLAKDVKQLPCQRPRLPVWVRVKYSDRP